MAGSSVPDFDVIVKRWNNFQRIVQANKKGESPSVSFESHERRIGEGHALEQPIHKTNQQSSVQIGDRQPRQGDLALACGRQSTNGAYKESGWGRH